MEVFSIVHQWIIETVAILFCDFTNMLLLKMKLTVNYLEEAYWKLHWKIVAFKKWGFSNKELYCNLMQLGRYLKQALSSSIESKDETLGTCYLQMKQKFLFLFIIILTRWSTPRCSRRTWRPSCSTNPATTSNSKKATAMIPS